MNIVLLQTQIALEDVEQLLHEFPHYLFLSFTEATYRNLSQENWSQVEILYGCRLTEEELARAHQLRWIHCPEQDLNRLCFDSIEKKGNIILSSVKEENLHQIGEYVMSGILAFSKNLFRWHDADKHPKVLWDSKWRENMWTLSGKQFLQIGLKKTGTEITSCAQQMGMRVWGVSEQSTFHPHCHKTFSFQHLHSILPNVDIISIALPKTKEFEGMIGEEELKLMKDDSLLILLGNPKIIDEKALVEQAPKFRGILLDAMFQTPISSNSPLWKLPNILITPDVAPRPKSHEGQSFAVFRYNLRQYTHGNFKDMRNVVTHI